MHFFSVFILSREPLKPLYKGLQNVHGKHKLWKKKCMGFKKKNCTEINLSFRSIVHELSKVPLCFPD